jgi:hypothetical protein
VQELLSHCGIPDNCHMPTKPVLAYVSSFIAFFQGASPGWTLLFIIALTLPWTLIGAAHVIKAVAELVKVSK